MTYKWNLITNNVIETYNVVKCSHEAIALTSTNHNKIFIEKLNVVGKDKEAILALMGEKVPTYKKR